MRGKARGPRRQRKANGRKHPWPRKWAANRVQGTALGNRFHKCLFSQDLVVLKRRLSSSGDSPCFLYLRCDPRGGGEIVSVGVFSSARNMEVYLGEEYCGTSRGRRACRVPDTRFVACGCRSVLGGPVFFPSALAICIHALSSVPDVREEEIKIHQQE